jgi:hypothetical protein
MDCIPNEILSHIFQLILLDPEENPACSFSISQVCVRWRDLAISSPSLWARVAFTFPIEKFQFSYARLALERSGSQPLSLLMDCRDPEWDWEEDGHSFRNEYMEAILENLLPHAARWKSVDLLTDTWAPIHIFLRLTKSLDDISQLESLSLSRCNAYFAARGQVFQPIALRDPIPLFGGAVAPRLTEVALVGVHLDWVNSGLRNLTTLAFKYHALDVLPSLSQFAAMLESSPHLEHLSIIGWGPRLDPESLSIVTSIVLPSLTKLSFGFIDMAYGTQLLSLFQLPSLRELGLEDADRVVSPLETQDSHQILQWLYSSQPTARASFAFPDGVPINPIPLQSVRKLELQSVRSSREIFSSFFQCFPNLLSLSCLDVSDGVLEALEPYPVDAMGSSAKVGCRCPALRELYCLDSNAELLVALVTSRSVIGSVAPLRTVTLEYSRTSRPRYDSDQYIRLENTGIQVLGVSSSSEASDSE